MKKIIPVIIICILFLSGCSVSKNTADNQKAMDYTVVTEDTMPVEITEIVKQKKAGEFTSSCSLAGYLYIIVGYGTQSTGGYSIRVDELCESDTNINIRTTLIGPAAGEPVNKMPTYPYIVIKTEDSDKNIVFE